MATIVTKTIGSGGGRDYASIGLWLAAAGDLVSADTVWKGVVYNDSPTSGALNFSTGITADATRYLWLTVAPGHSICDQDPAVTALRWDTSKGASHTAGQHGGMAIDANNYVLIERMQFFVDSSGYGQQIYCHVNTLFRQCLFLMTRTVNFVEPNSAHFHATNCVLDFACAGGGPGRICTMGELRNCTILRPTDYTAGGAAFITYYGQLPLVVNTALLGSWSSFMSSSGFPGGTGNNASNYTGTMPGSGNVGSLTVSNEIENGVAATRDMRPKSGHSLQAGSVDSSYTLDVDFFGRARPTSGATTVGAVEYSVPATPVWNLVSHVAVAGNASNAITSAIDTTGADLLVASASWWPGGGAGSVTDSKGNTWTPLTYSTNDSWRAQLFYVQGGTVGSGHTFTFNAAYASFFVVAFSGSSSSPFDQQNGAQRSSGAPDIQPGLVIPTEDDELIITGVNNGDISAATTTIDSGFTISDVMSASVGNYQGGGMAWRAQTTAYSTNPTWTFGTSSNGPVAVIATFKGEAPAAGAGPDRYDTITISELANANMLLRPGVTN